MKKLSLLLSILSFLLTFTACTDAKLELLKHGVEEMNALCPINIEEAGEITAVSYCDSTREVIYTMKLNMKAGGNVDQHDLSTYKQLFMGALMSHDTAVKQLIKTIADINVGLAFDIVTKESGKAVKIAFTPQEVKDIYNNPPSPNEGKKLLLENAVKLNNSSCPLDMGGGLVMKKVALQGNSLLYEYEVDEDSTALSLYREQSRKIKQQMVAALTAGDTSRELVNMCVALSKSMIYNYVGKATGETVSIIFTLDELKKVLNGTYSLPTDTIRVDSIEM